MLDINVEVDVVRGVSMMYAITVGKLLAKLSKRIEPLADQTKTSIWPGVSTRKWDGGLLLDLGSGVARFSRRPMTWSTLVAKRLREVRMPPLGPRLYCRMTSL